MIKDSSKYALLDSIGKTSSLTENAHAETLTFIQTVLYGGQEETFSPNQNMTLPSNENQVISVVHQILIRPDRLSYGFTTKLTTG